MKRLLYILFAFPALINMDAYSQAPSWDIFRGTADLSGMAATELPDNPVLLWSVSTGAATKSSPVVSNGLIFFGNDKGELVAVTTEGKIKWRFKGDDPVEAPPLVAGDKVVFSTSDGLLRAVDKSTGRLRWNYATENQIVGSANSFTSGGKTYVFVGSYDYYLHCVESETGKPLWKLETDNYINGTPALYNNRIIFGGCDGIIRIVDPVSGKQNDTANIGIYLAASPAVSSGKAVFGDYDGTVYCLDITTKKKVWKIAGNAESGAILSIPAIANGLTFIGSEDRYLYCYNLSDGKLNWKYRTNGRLISSPVVTRSKVLIAGMDRNVIILRQSDGARLWTFNAGSPVSSSPAVTGNRFYILTEDGRLLAFGQK